jgi:Cu-Zn family superoxide dismutase
MLFESSMVLLIFLLIFKIFGIGIFDILNLFKRKPKRKLIRAVCVMTGCTENDKIRGILYLNELIDGNTHVYGKIQNLPITKIRNGNKHAFHIHETGNTINGCTSLKGHYNPFNKLHSSRIISDGSGNTMINYERHVGDLGNIVVNKKGEARIDFIDPLVKLDGPTSVLGRSMVIHLGVDDLGNGNTKESMKTGSAGKRISWGIIGHK